MRLRPQTFVAEVSPGRLQVGSAPPHTVVFSDLSAHEIAWIRKLAGTGSAADKTQRRQSVSAELTERQNEILRMLDAAGLLAEEHGALEGLRIQINGLGTVGIQTARHLADAGARTLELRDRRRIGASVEHLFDPSAAGLLRQSALTESLRRRHRDLRVGASGAPDVAVVCCDNTWDLGVLGRLLSQDIPHLPIVERDREVQVGPLVVPGQTGCALCADLARRDVFPLWAQTSLALASAPTPKTPSHMCATAAGLAVTLIRCCATGDAPAGASRPSGLGGASHSFTVSEAGVTTQEWYPHPECACHEDGLFAAPRAA